MITEVPFQQFRDRIVERIAELVNSDKIAGISGVTDLSDLNEPVRIVVDVKRDADPEVVLNQLYQFSPLQDTFSLILLALVDGKPRLCSLKELLDEFLRHRVTVIRRRTQFLLAKARRRKHTVEGLLLALANIDEVIRIIRHSQTQAEAKVGLMGVQCPAAMMAQALGEEGFQQFQQERGVAGTYALTAVQADAILRMTLGQLVNLEQQKLSDEHRELLREIAEYLRILSDEQNILEIIKEEFREIRRRFGDDRRTEITGEELGQPEPGGPDHRGDHGGLDQPPRLHQAHGRPACTAPDAAAGKGSSGPRSRTRTRSSICSWPAPTPTCCSSRTGARSTGRRCSTCRS